MGGAHVGSRTEKWQQHSHVYEFPVSLLSWGGWVTLSHLAGGGRIDFVEVHTAVSGPKNSEPARQQVLQQLSSAQQYLLSFKEIVAV